MPLNHIPIEKQLLDNVGDFALIGPNSYGMINYVNKIAPKKESIIKFYKSDDCILNIEILNRFFIILCSISIVCIKVNTKFD